MNEGRTAVILGSTGAVGGLWVERLAQEPGTQVVALAAAGTNLPRLAAQAVELQVYGIALVAGDVGKVNAALDLANEQAERDVRPEILIGEDVVAHAAAAGADLVVNAIDGPAGIEPSRSALRTGAHLKVANTETLLTAELLGAELPDAELPDAELPGHAHLSERITLYNPELGDLGRTLAEHRGEISRVIITAPSRPRALGRRRASRHAVDRTTGFAAGFALAQVAALTSAPIDVVLHPGAIGALVELTDGRTIIHRRAGAPEEPEGRIAWSFEPADLPAVGLCRAAVQEGRTYPAVAFAANDVATGAHANSELDPERIFGIVAQVLDAHDAEDDVSWESVRSASRWAESYARDLISSSH